MEGGQCQTRLEDVEREEQVKREHTAPSPAPAGHPVLRLTGKDRKSRFLKADGNRVTSVEIIRNLVSFSLQMRAVSSRVTWSMKKTGQCEQESCPPIGLKSWGASRKMSFSFCFDLHPCLWV